LNAAIAAVPANINANETTTLCEDKCSLFMILKLSLTCHRGN
jgi:hypothetical protein